MNREAERKRLVELLRKDNCCIDFDCSKCMSKLHCFPHSVADLLLDNGIVVPPCKVGDMAYFIIEDEMEGGKYITSQRINDVSTRGIFISTSTLEENCDDFEPFSKFGKTVFLTREQAEKSLEGKGE